MRYPPLVPAKICRVPIRVVIESENLNENGAPEIVFDKELTCNYQDGGKAEILPDARIIRVTARAYFPGDICPEIANITGGHAVIFGVTREIHQGFKRRNPDGTVNYTEIQFK